MKKFSLIFLFAILLTSCSLETLTRYGVIQPTLQKSKFMKATGGGFLIDTEKRGELTYVVGINFINKSNKAKYLIADFEDPTHKGSYVRKVFSLTDSQEKIMVRSDPIYDVKYGIYLVRISLSEDEKGMRLVDSMDQYFKALGVMNVEHDYATEYTLFGDGKEIKKTIIVYPSNKDKKLITFDVQSDFKLGYAAVSNKKSIAEYVPRGEGIHNWSKMISLLEMEKVSGVDKPYPAALTLNKTMYEKFSKPNDEVVITYKLFSDGRKIGLTSESAQHEVKHADEIIMYFDYSDTTSTKKLSNQREYLVVKTLVSDVSIWMVQYTVKYNTKWSKERISLIKKEADNFIAGVRLTKVNPVVGIDKMAHNNGMQDFSIKSRRLDDQELSKSFKDK